MTPFDWNHPEVAKIIPAAVGSAGALFWIQGTWPKKIGMFFLGASMSYLGTPYVSDYFGLAEGFAGFLLGLFGMSMVDKVMDTWQKFDLGATLKQVLDRFIGFPKTPK